jgi:GNAT superfamily N-acetyltransferase
MEAIVRKAQPDDVPAMLRLIKELAVYERAPHSVINTEERMLEDGFGKQAIYKALVAEKSCTIVGLALYYLAYSTWKGKIFYLDDLIVTEKERRKGIGKMLIEAVLNEAKQSSVNQIRWQVLEWNTPAIEFYKKMGVDFDSQWINCSMSKEAIHLYFVQ